MDCVERDMNKTNVVWRLVGSKDESVDSDGDLEIRGS